MYYPVQIPYILSKEFFDTVLYTEEFEPKLKDFLLCFWEMKPKSEVQKTIENIIVADGCIDLVVDFANEQIGFVGMSKTNFEVEISSPCNFFGARMKPGAFFVLTGISAIDAMDNFIPLVSYDENFDADCFFDLSFEKAKQHLSLYLQERFVGKTADKFIELFDELSSCNIKTTAEIYEKLNFSPKQCQRLFRQHFGLTPQMVLCIIRFQKCLEMLISGKASQNDVLQVASHYDQAHFIKDFKRNIGLMPYELVSKYRG